MTRHVAPIAGALAPLLLLALSACPKPLPPVGQAPQLPGGQRHTLTDGVDHDEVIAEAVHFGETQHVYRLALASEQ